MAGNKTPELTLSAEHCGQEGAEALEPAKVEFDRDNPKYAAMFARFEAAKAMIANEGGAS